MPPKAPSNFQPSTYQLENTGEWLNHLETEGYVVLAEAISPELAEKAKTMFLDEIHTISPGFNPLLSSLLPFILLIKFIRLISLSLNEHTL